MGQSRVQSSQLKPDAANISKGESMIQEGESGLPLKLRFSNGSLIVLLTALVSLPLFSTDIYLASMPEIALFFDITPAHAQMTLSSYMVGFALSVLFCGCISDRFGRRPVALCGITIHFLSTLLCLMTSYVDVLIIARFFQALGGCCGTVLGRVIVRDLYGQNQCVKILSIMATGMTVAPAAAPILGGYLQLWFGWKASFLILAMTSGLILIFSFFILEESLAVKNKNALKPAVLLSNYWCVIKNKQFLGYTLNISFAWCGYFSFITGSSFIFINQLQVAPQEYGMLYAVVIFGYLIGTFLAGRLSSYFDMRQSVLFGSFLALTAGIVLFLLNWFFTPSLTIIMVPMFFYLLGIGMIMPNGQVAATDPFPHLIGSAASLLYFIEMVSGAITGTAVALCSHLNLMPMILGTTCASLGLFIVFLLMIKKPLQMRNAPLNFAKNAP